MTSRQEAARALILESRLMLLLEWVSRCRKKEVDVSHKNRAQRREIKHLMKAIERKNEEIDRLYEELEELKDGET